MANVEDIQTKVNNYMALSEPYLGENESTSLSGSAA